MRKLGRSPEHLKVLPGAFVVVGDTVDEAQKRKALLDSLVHPDSGLASLSIALGCDATDFDLDGPLPDIPDSNASKSGRERFVTLAKNDNLTVRQLARIAGSFSGLAFVGRPSTIADEMEQWLFEEGCDGFNIMFPYVPEGLEDFVDKVVPELQRRDLFRREYEGNTSRENLGLPRPQNQFFKSPEDLSGERAEVATAFLPLENG
jgi:alkanesulfonate monooxygenase SsuD/methylene tetrahydromethanopterin reductase-like flavin-dependent oxidoreductase (luciferase family)